jgi:hypothetical protein
MNFIGMETSKIKIPFVLTLLGLFLATPAQSTEDPEKVALVMKVNNTEEYVEFYTILLNQSSRQIAGMTVDLTIEADNGISYNLNVKVENLFPNQRQRLVLRDFEFAYPVREILNVYVDRVVAIDPNLEDIDLAIDGYIAAQGATLRFKSH